MLLQLQSQLPVSGGMSGDSALPNAEALLENDDVREAIEFVAARKHMDRYWSIMDFLICELEATLRPMCLDFYEHDGPDLASTSDDSFLVALDLRIVIALHVAVKIHRRGSRTTWSRFSHRTRQIFEKIVEDES